MYEIHLYIDNIILILKDEGTFALKSAARRLLKDLSSEKATHLGWRDTWCFVTTKGSGE